MEIDGTAILMRRQNDAKLHAMAKLFTKSLAEDRLAYIHLLSLRCFALTLVAGLRCKTEGSIQDVGRQGSFPSMMSDVERGLKGGT
jgi:hypothetical protein